MIRSDINSKIISVIVTYGCRKTYLLSVIDRLKIEGIDKLIVVNNGSSWLVQSVLSCANHDIIDVINLNENTGSANAYAIGIERAISIGADFIWLLDDDNLPDVGSLKKLLDIHIYENNKNEQSLLACTPYRVDQYGELDKFLLSKIINSRENSFCNFHVYDIPRRILNKLGINKRIEYNRFVSLKAAPYGGLFFSAKLVGRIGLPDKNLILYGDDIEYTRRITRNSGRILMDTSINIKDLESSWKSIKARPRILEGWLIGQGDFRAFYAMRNMTYVDLNFGANNKIIFLINFLTFKFILRIFSYKYHAQERYNLLCEAINAGLHSNLGINKKYPLP